MLSRREILKLSLMIAAGLGTARSWWTARASTRQTFLYLGPWEWRSDNPQPACWRPPVGAIGGLDLRNLIEQATPGPIASGSGLFISPIPLRAPYIFIGDDPAEIITSSRKEAIQNALSKTLKSSRLNDLIWEAFFKGDPEGIMGLKPLLPSANGYEICLPDILFKRRAVDMESPEWAQSLRVLQGDYRKIRLETLAGIYSPGTHRKFLGALLQQYDARDFRQFIALGLPIEEPIAPTTTLAEDFAGSTSVLGNLLTWTNLTAISVRNNASARAERSGTPYTDAPCRAESDLSSADHNAQMDTVVAHDNSFDAFNPMTRFSPSADTAYGGLAWTLSTIIEIAKWNAGTKTSLGFDNTGPSGTPWTLKMDSSGSTQTVFLNGTQHLQFTDTTITGNLRTGFRSGFTDAGTAAGDNFTSIDGLGGDFFMRRRAR